MLVVHRRYERLRSESAFLTALGGIADLRVHGEKGSFAGYDVVIHFVAFRDLVAAPPIDWDGFTGLRLMLEHDAVCNYLSVSEQNPYVGAWPAVFERHRFDHLVVSGGLLAERFWEDGVPTSWLPKGYDPSMFFDHGGQRGGAVHYGSRYRARASMLHRVRAAGFSVEEVNVQYELLASQLNRFRLSLICNLAGHVPFGRVGRAVNRLRPITVIGGPTEVMIKNFESAAAGCCVIADWHPDMSALGFEDGVNVITYRSFDELVERLHEARRRDRWTAEIAEEGARLVRERHTWAHRAADLDRLLTRLLGSAA